MSMNTCKKIKIAAVAPPFSGHLYPLLKLLSSLLVDQSYEIYVFSGIEKKELIESQGFIFKALLENINESAFRDIANTSKQTNLKLRFKQLEQNINLINKIIPELEREFKEINVDIVIADFIAVPAGVVANELKIPWITSIPTPFAIENKIGTPSYLGGLKPRVDFFGKTRDFFARKLVRICKKTFYFLVLNKLEYKKLKLYNEKDEENIYSPYSILALGMKELEFRDDFPKQLIWAGPCMLATNSEKNISKSDFINFKKKVLLTIGTHLLWGKDKIIELAEYLASFYPDIVFIVSLGNDRGKEQGVKVKENVFIYDYLDYDYVLSEIDYVIHHGGAGILYSCIKFAKPALIIPHDYDQFDYAVRAEISDIAISVKKRDKKIIKKAFDKLVERKEWKNLFELSNKLKSYKTDEILRSEIERLCNKRG